MNRPTKLLFFLVLLPALTQLARATYNPQTGRWLNRDPIEERGFALMTTDSQPEYGRRLDEPEPEPAADRPHREPNSPNLSGFVLNDPANRVDAFGLISFNGCSAAKQATLTAAWNSACQMVNDPRFQCCVGRSGFIQMFKRRCAWGNVKFKCRQNNQGLCKYGVCAHAWQSLGVGRGVIVICDRDASECGLSWTCLLAHEFSHVIGWDPAHRGVTQKVEDCCKQR